MNRREQHEGTSRWLAMSSPRIFEVSALVLLLLVAAVDAIAPPEFSAVLLYIVPLGMVAWLGSPRSRWLTTLLVVVIWTMLFWFERSEHSWWLFFWIVIEKAVVFGGTAYLLGRLKQVLVEQRRLNRLLSDRVRIVEQLAAGVAHEVRNPLSTMLSGVEYLARRERADSERLLLQDMRSAVTRAELIVRDLSDFSAPLRLNFAAIPISTAIEQAAREAQSRANTAKVSIETNALPSVAARIDLTRTVQVLVNLLHNAIDVSVAGGSVRITAYVTHGSELNPKAIGPTSKLVAIDIDDDGPGIPEERMAQVFEPFYTTKAPGSGTGLGLAVSRRIVDDHGGLLRFTNRPGKGLRATLLLPMGDST